MKMTREEALKLVAQKIDSFDHLEIENAKAQYVRECTNCRAYVSVDDFSSVAVINGIEKTVDACDDCVEKQIKY